MYWKRIDAVFKCQRTAEKGFGPEAAIKPFLVHSFVCAYFSL